MLTTYAVQAIMNNMSYQGLYCPQLSVVSLYWWSWQKQPSSGPRSPGPRDVRVRGLGHGSGGQSGIVSQQA